MHRSKLGGLIIDCETDDLEVAEQFWTRALGFEPLRSSDPDDEGCVPLKTDPGEPHVELQRVSHPSRVHIDIATDGVEAEVERLLQLGATKVEKVSSWWIMQAPTGHRFCVVRAEEPDLIGKVNRWD